MIKEAHGTGGIFTVADILARSSNVGAVRIGLRLGATRFDKWVRRFGFGELDRPAAAGRVAGHRAAASKDYSGSSIGNLPIGQGLAVTPIQMMQRLRGDRERRHAREAAAGAGRRARRRARA